MKILVTGATGFVGACLTRRLVTKGHDVHLFVRRESDRWRIEDILSHLTEHEVDLADAAGVMDGVSRVRPQAIFHLATYGGFAFQNETREILATNFSGTVNLLTACERVGFDLFVNTGSSSEYGIKNRPMHEDDLLEPLGDYGVTKAAATLFCRSEGVGKGLPVATLRLFSPFGPWDDRRRLIPTVISSLLRGEPPHLSCPGSVRDNIFIDDVTDLYLRLLEIPVIPGEIINVGSGAQHTISDVVTTIGEIVAAGVEPLWGTRETVRPEPAVWRADIERARARFGWSPVHSLRDGLENTVSWMRRHQEYYKERAA